MQSIRIYILTTTGASRIVYLDREDADSGIRSSIRLDGETDLLQISKSYRDFVDTFVQRFSGHRVYRADVGARIEGGSSWQLGLLTAHWVLESDSNRLAVEEQPSDVTLFVSGILRDRPAIGEIEVSPVEGLEDKFRAAKDVIHAELKANRKVFFVLPEGNRVESEAILTSETAYADAACLFVGSFDQVKQQLESTRGAERAGSLQDPVQRTGRKRTLFGLGAAVACGLLALFFVHSFGGAGLRPDAGQGPVDPDKGEEVAFTLYAIGPKDKQGCSGSHFRNTEDVATPLLESGVNLLEEGAMVCSIRLTARNRTGTATPVYSFLYQGDEIGAVKGDGVLHSSQHHLIEPESASLQLYSLPRFRFSRESWNLVAFTGPADGQLDPEQPFADFSTARQAYRNAVEAGEATFQRRLLLEQ